MLRVVPGPDVVATQGGVRATVGIDDLAGQMRVLLPGEPASRVAIDSGPWWPFSGIGTAASTWAARSGSASSCSVIGVSTVPGATAFSGIPRPAHSGEIEARRTQRLRARFEEG